MLSFTYLLWLFSSVRALIVLCPLLFSQVFSQKSFSHLLFSDLFYFIYLFILKLCKASRTAVFGGWHIHILCKPQYLRKPYLKIMVVYQLWIETENTDLIPAWKMKRNNQKSVLKTDSWTLSHILPCWTDSIS